MGNNKDQRYQLLLSVLIISLLLLWTVGFRLVMIKGSYFRQIARENRLVQKNIPAVRGNIVDRKGRILANSWYRYYRVEGENKIFEDEGPFNGFRFEGGNLAYEVRRQYPYKEALGFVVGYVGYPTKDELKKEKCDTKIDSQSLVGRMGIEQFADCELRGKDGQRLIEVDAMGKYVREMGRNEPITGQDVELSIDAYWQEKAFNIIKDFKAVMIVSEVNTGKIIVLVSSPTFDPNAFSGDRDNEKISWYLNDKEGLPMLNRTIGGEYHPGSVFKIIVATGGLESKKIDENTLFEDTGFIKIGDYTYNNWLWTKRGGTDGMVNIIKGMTTSNDIYFYRLGEQMGPRLIKKWANKFGLGEKTGIEISGESLGLVPDEDWKLKVKNERWFLGNTYHMAIGQGDVTVTPLQISRMTNVIASNGWLCKMSLIKNSKPNCDDLKISNKTIDLVKQGMVSACRAGGTAYPLFNFKTSIACKTGTAEVGDGSSKDTHAWLTAFGPVDNPEISITVMVERGGEGSDTAAPLVGDFLKEWFNEPETIVPRKKN